MTSRTTRSSLRTAYDPGAKITKMKNGRTHLVHKAEHEIDLETGAIVGITVQDADHGDTTTSQTTFTLGLWMRSLFGISTPRALQERVALREVLTLLWDVDLRSRRADLESELPARCQSDGSESMAIRARENAASNTGCWPS